MAHELPEPPFHDSAAEVLHSAREHLAELLELFTLEVRYSGLMLGKVVAMAVIAALATFSVWGLLMAAMLMALLGSGWSWPATLMILALANGGTLFGALWLMRRSLMRIGVDGTRQALGLGLGLEVADVSD